MISLIDFEIHQKYRLYGKTILNLGTEYLGI